jgi:hypothetical protein
MKRTKTPRYLESKHSLMGFGSQGFHQTTQEPKPVQSNIQTVERWDGEKWIRVYFTTDKTVVKTEVI